MADTFSMRDINVTLGAFEVGVLICMFLLGASTVQAYVYYGRFPLDPWPVKALVSVFCAVLFFLCPNFQIRLLQREVHMITLLNNSYNVSILGL